jgi:hypothetical protein
LASKRALNAELKKSGRMPMAGLTSSAAMPWMRRRMKAGRNVARERARRAWGADLVKIVKLRRGPGMLVVKDYLGEKCLLKTLLKFDVQYRRRST